jgi:hypothetical protein
MYISFFGFSRAKECINPCTCRHAVQKRKLSAGCTLALRVGSPIILLRPGKNVTAGISEWFHAGLLKVCCRMRHHCLVAFSLSLHYNAYKKSGKRPRNFMPRDGQKSGTPLSKLSELPRVARLTWEKIAEILQKEGGKIKGFPKIV